MADDATLLADYATNGSEEAFRALVERYLPLVYSAAVRQVGGDTHLAQDIAQRVFVDLARKAGTLHGDSPLGGWLHRHTCYVAATVLRTERRRMVRERQAIEMSTMQENPESAWEDTALLLDDAINKLGNEDRAAIVVRFLEQRDLCSVGLALGISEDAAQKRVSRALEKLRVMLGRRGVALSAAGLAVTLTTQAVATMPTGLAAAVSTAALTGAATTSGFTLAALKFITMTKLKVALAGAVVVAGVATPILLQQQSNGRLRTEIESLRQQNQTLEQLREENPGLAAAKVDVEELQRLREEHAELIRLRGQAAALRQREQELAQALAELRRLRSPATSNPQTAAQNPAQPASAESLKPASEWNNVGIATPGSAYETWNWAKAHADVDALARTLVLDAAARTNAEALLAALPESVRAKYGSVEGMMAVMTMNMKPAITAARVVSQDELDANNVILHTQWQGADGQIGQNDWRLFRDQDGWRFVISSGLVEKLGKGLRLGGLTSSESPKP